MAKYKLIYLAILSSCLLPFSCDEVNFNPNISFDSPFPKRQKNLSFILGDQFTFVLNADTQTINVKFDGKTKLNYLTNAKSGDTLSRCWVSKFRQLYYFSEQVNDTSFWIYAVKIGDNQMNGLHSGWEQMMLLQSEIEKGKYPELVKYRNPATKFARLTYNKTRLENFYKSIVDSMPTAKLINTAVNSEVLNQTHTITSTTSKEVLEQGSTIVRRVYPNPASGNFNIEFSEEGNFKIEISDLNGKNLKSFQVNSDKTNIDLKGINPGIYYVRTTEQGTNESALIKLIVQ